MPCARKKLKIQKLIIPKGMVNPNQTTIVEIPLNMKKQPILVARRKDFDVSSRFEADLGHATVYSRRDLVVEPISYQGAVVSAFRAKVYTVNVLFLFVPQFLSRDKDAQTSR